MNFKTILVALAAMMMGFATQAEETTGETKTKVESQNKVDGDLDNEITNAKMRAESGSKSKYSGSITAGYLGGSLEDPTDENRANLLGGNELPRVLGYADIAGRYRFTKNTSMKVGTGMTVVQPFHNVEDDYLDKVEVSDPYVSFSNYRRLGNTMLSTSAGTTFYTNEASRDILGLMMSVDASATALYDFKNGVQAGIVGAIGYEFGDGSSLVKAANASDFSLAWHPFVEYQINDKYNLRTIWNFGINHRRYSVPKGVDRWANNLTRQSFGLGIAATRDIFLYPNVQISTRDFYSEVEFKQTTVGMSATINAF